MTAFLDSSVLVAALIEDEPRHEACLRLLTGKPNVVWSHAFAETFSTLTGGRLGVRVAPAVATELIESSLLPRVRVVELGVKDIVGALRDTEDAGVRGGAFYDYLHLVAARKARARALYTLNDRHFAALARRGDPSVQQPGE